MYLFNLFEDSSPNYYFHVTKTENINNIIRHGLIPNHSNDGIGNYDDFKWLSLYGVYATNQIGLIKQYITSHHLQQNFTICILSISGNSVLPDEDTITILLSKIVKDLYDEYNISTDYYDLDEYFEHRYDNDEPDDMDLKNQNQFWDKVGSEFHRIASNGDSVIFNKELIEELCYGYNELFGSENSEIHPEEWKNIKDQISKIYRNIPHPTFGSKWSIRVDNTIGFTGNNRIVAIVRCEDYIAETITGNIPPMIANIINGLLDSL